MDRLEFQRRAYEIIDDLGGNNHAKEAVLERLMVAHDEAVEAALTDQEEHVAAGEVLARVLRSKILGLPDHPWIPGGQFADGELMRALKRVEGHSSLEDPEDVNLEIVEE